MDVDRVVPDEWLNRSKKDQTKQKDQGGSTEEEPAIVRIGICVAPTMYSVSSAGTSVRNESSAFATNAACSR